MSLSMPPNANPSPTGVLRQGRLADAVPALFNTTMLKDETAIQAAIGAISCHLVDPATPLQDALLELASEAPAHILELVLCAVGDDAYRALVAAILEGYERDLKGLLSSLAPGLLSRFALCHWFLPGACRSATANTPDVTYTLQWKDVEAGTAVLQELSKLFFVSANRPCNTSNDNDLPFGMKYARSQGQRKRTRREKDVPAIDHEVFNRYDASVPQTAVEVHELTRSICDIQGHALKEYLDMFRRPEVVAAIRSIFLRSPEDVPGEAEEDNNCSDDGLEDNYSICSDDGSKDSYSNRSYDGSEEGAADPVAFPFVRPIKAARLFDSTEDFGTWGIRFEPRAIRDLRQARDGKMFNIYVKKIKELSRGHFSEDNQKRLTGVQMDIHVYEAKMTGDTRLVYRIDCEKDPHDGVEQQVLRIRGIYTHTQINRRFWDAIRRDARELAQQKDAEYKKRCTFRNPPVNPGDNVFAPATWRPRRIIV